MFTVYNLRVAEDHTYFVGREEWGFSVWVHNAYTWRKLANGTYEIIDNVGDVVKTGVKNLDNAEALVARWNKWTTTIHAGKKFKQHFIAHKHLLENLMGTKYPKWKTSAQAFLDGIAKAIDTKLVQFVGKGTLKKGQPIVNIYRGNGVTIITKLDGEFVTILESGRALDKSIVIIP